MREVFFLQLTDNIREPVYHQSNSELPPEATLSATIYSVVSFCLIFHNHLTVP